MAADATVKVEGERPGGPAGPVTLVIFGASGDLTKRKLLPALYALAHDRLLPERFAIIGFARREKTSEAFRDEMRADVEQFSRLRPVRAEVWDRLARGLYYVTGPFEDSAGYERLRDLLQERERDNGAGRNRVYYLATPPEAYPVIVGGLGAAGLVTEAWDGPDEDAPGAGWSRIIVEKPFGRDLDTARALNADLHRVFRERQVYRIDHYLGKETVQNILTFRFGNSIFEPLWNRRYVDHVQLLVGEDLGVESRGGYYDSAGAMRDMVQNHMLQLLSLVAMEPPATFEADAVRDEKVKVLRAIRPIPVEPDQDRTVRGQYVSGLLRGKKIAAYADEPGVGEETSTETYAALRLEIDNWRWAGVPFYLRTGKALPKRVTEVTIQYRRPPLRLFEHAPHPGHQPGDEIEPNRLTLRIQPDEGISLRVGLKPPGPRISLVPARLGFAYHETFGAEPAEAYERLLLDCMLGDATLFIRRDEVETAWALVTPVLEAWAAAGRTGLTYYPAGSWGPKEADRFIQADGREWVNP
ncbi:MAG: glucose-6-phosphate dehydrogenase [candidate division NC10 bacterium]|nr:glucose-6-phosphate dehydrogenase [candidate division NC10 bacterium]MBI2457216.1 glucose-6-phosphate dehydrogenase [candidate division NC10 bacterium]MBI2563438.1 glucose-6-phosphate dehydrogenase [candidate division NC10 bacterium]